MSDENISPSQPESPRAPAPTPSSDKGTAPRILFLDVLRAIACLMVVFYHSAVNIGFTPYVIWGYCGVHLFFVLSGYLLAVPYCKALLAGTPLPDVRIFYLRRFIRVLPPYFVALAVFIAIRVAKHMNIPSTENIISHVFLVFNYGPDVDFFSINTVFWTLAIEAQFYLFLPVFMAILAWCINKFKSSRSATVLTGLLFLLVVGLLTRLGEFYWHSNSVPHVEDAIKFKSFLAFLDLFVAGMLVAFFKHVPEEHPLRKFSPFRMIAVGIGLIVVSNLWLTIRGHHDWMTVNEMPTAVFFPILVAGGFACILLAHILAPEKTGKLLQIPVLAWVGRISYSVYLYHVGVQFVSWSIFRWERYITNFQVLAMVNALTSLPVVLLVSYIMYALIEKPSLGWMDSLQKRKQPIKAASG